MSVFAKTAATFGIEFVRDPASRREGLEGRGQRHRADNGRKVIGLDMRRSTTCVW